MNYPPFPWWIYHPFSWLIIKRPAMLNRVISTKLLTHRVSAEWPSLFSKKNLSRLKWRPFWIFEFFAKIAKHKNAYISKTMLDRVISMKFLNRRVSAEWPSLFSKKNLSHLKWRPFWIFEFFAKIAKHKNAYISKTVLDRADYADFGCHNSIRLEAEDFLHTLALTVISSSGHFVFAVQKHSFFL